MVIGRTMGVDTEHVDYFVINKATVGRRHAILKQKDGAWWLVDLGSVNGTFVNDERVLGERQLRPGDRIRFHKFEFAFTTEGKESPQAGTFSGEQTLVSDRNTLLAAGLSAEDLAALEADREAFFSNPDGDDVNIEPRAVAGRDDRTLDDGRAAALLSERSAAAAALGKDLTFEVPVPAAVKPAVDPDLQKTQRLHPPAPDSARD
ncbi:MAG: FHA domain-containing protein [Gammaproteobacteria bacterium]|nr:FHA domain-containing protein [Gammaproteobacteria bacterium]